ncbi:MAG: cobalamin-dependent protein [Firmicutes bacterium]|nr:cobalamin-dependent protein [Bacillota bacterium]MDH7496460.1 OAM dimerization domain-containing protein [Bacillota bacterium]
MMAPGMKLDLTRIRPYGDTMDDGWVQLSFTLPVPCGREARRAAELLCEKMGLDDVRVVYDHDVADNFTFFVAYGRCVHSVDFTAIEVPKVNMRHMSFDEINRFIEQRIRRKVVVVAACTGTDAHTVGIDAIINMKGYAGEYGLERYPWFVAYNLGSQVPNESLVAKAIEVGADAILVSQVVTQKNIHIDNLTNLAELVEAEGIRDKVLLIMGGPRITHELAVELGYDAGFGPGTLPSHVGAFIAQELARRMGEG